VNILLQAIDRAGKDVEYYAVDLSLPELKRTFAEIPTEGYKHVKCFGLYGTYDHALEWLKSSDVREKPKTILWLGSSLGNFKRPEVPPFLTGFRDAIQPGDNMLIGIDSCKDPDRVFHAYNDRENVTHDFTLNGLEHANRIMGTTAFNLEEWQAIGEFDVESGRHHAFVSPLADVVVDGVSIPKGERIRIEESYKYSRDEILSLWDSAGLAENIIWKNSKGDYGKESPLFLDPVPFVRSMLTLKQAFTWSLNPKCSSLWILHSMHQSLCHRYPSGSGCGLHGMPSLER
jgi:EasF-like predicted methyltransferase